MMCADSCAHTHTHTKNTCAHTWYESKYGGRGGAEALPSVFPVDAATASLAPRAALSVMDTTWRNMSDIRASSTCVCVCVCVCVCEYDCVCDGHHLNNMSDIRASSTCV